jgi:hypothetical protein
MDDPYIKDHRWKSYDRWYAYDRRCNGRYT